VHLEAGLHSVRGLKRGRKLVEMRMVEQQDAEGVQVGATAAIRAAARWGHIGNHTEAKATGAHVA
jgi:hypothetical protein